VGLLREHDRLLAVLARELRVPPERVPDAVGKLRARITELEQTAARGGANGAVDIEQLVAQAQQHGDVRTLTAIVDVPDSKALLDVADRLKARLGEAAIVLGSTADDRVDLVAAVAPSLVTRGVRAQEIVTAAARIVGGGGGGRDTLARAGGRDPSKLPDAIAAARAAIEAALD
jgi:alanyl-tRNA synthetase